MKIRTHERLFHITGYFSSEATIQVFIAESVSNTMQHTDLFVVGYNKQYKKQKNCQRSIPFIRHCWNGMPNSTCIFFIKILWKTIEIEICCWAKMSVKISYNMLTTNTEWNDEYQFSHKFHWRLNFCDMPWLTVSLCSHSESRSKISILQFPSRLST